MVAGSGIETDRDEVHIDAGDLTKSACNYRDKGRSEELDQGDTILRPAARY